MERKLLFFFLIWVSLIRIITTTSQEMGVGPLQRGLRIIEKMGSVSKSSVYLGHNWMTSILNKHLFAKDQKGHRMLAGLRGITEGHGQTIRACMADGYTHIFAVSHNNS